jgi:RNA 2',3'-cyclic 3'-phosphodiesterase
MRPPLDAPPPLARLFLGLMLGPELGASTLRPLREALGESAGADLRLYRSEDLHMTLVFLGPVERARVDKLAAALPAHLPACTRLDLRLGATGAFPNRSQPRVLWLAVDEERAGALAELRALQASLAGLCRSQGFTLERRAFVPHLTVARLRGSARPPPPFWEAAANLAWRPREVALIESVSGVGQSAFRVLASWALPGPEGDSD